MTVSEVGFTPANVFTPGAAGSAVVHFKVTDNGKSIYGGRESIIQWNPLYRTPPIADFAILGWSQTHAHINPHKYAP